MLDNTRAAVILGALLHDIGKLWQRSEKEVSFEKAKYLTRNTKDSIADFCPLKDHNRYSHLHSAWTYQFFDSFENEIRWLQGSGEDSPIHLAAGHHKPSTTLQEIVRIADWMSSAQDRSKETEDEKQEIQQRFAFRRRRLHPVFESVFRQEYENGQLRMPLETLSLERSDIFPYDPDSEEKDLHNEYRKLWDGFESEIKLLPQGSFTVFMDTVIDLIRKYTWCIPSSTNDFPDISLYDHLKTTAAIAVCLYDYFQQTRSEWVEPGNKSQKGRVTNWCRNGDESFAKLVCGDLSGIQPFLYRITSKKAAVSLKGRSFALQLLSDAIARHILAEFQLPLTNLVYSSGGNFYLLAPNLEDFQKRFTNVQNDINAGLLKRYDGELYLGLGSTDISNQDLLHPSPEDEEAEHTLKHKWQAAIESANADKKRRFQALFQIRTDFFEPYGECADVEQCQACGKNTRAQDLENLSSTNEEESVRVCAECHQFIKLGNRLKQMDWLVEFNGDVQDHDVYRPLPGIGAGFIITDNDQLARKIEICQSAEYVKVHRINDTAFLPPQDTLRAADRAYGFRFYGGNALPFDEEKEPLTFTDLAGAGGFKRVGVLRMDVDNLGYIIQHGFVREKPDGDEIRGQTSRYSISRLSTLSSNLDLFFTGYINTIRDEKFEREVIIIYSGGDDLFLVGKWSAIIEMARDVRQEFQAFTGSHPRFTISGGIAIVTPKHPIHHGADLAQAGEEQAKSIDADKDAVAFLGKAVKWTDFLELERLKNQIIEITDRIDSQALIDRLRRIYATYDTEKRKLEQEILTEEERHELVNYNKWRWRMVYSLKRLARKEKKAGDDIEQVRRRLTELLPSGRDVIALVDVPARWAEFLIRSKPKHRR